MIRAFCIFLCLCFPLSASGQVKVILPKEVSGKAGSFIRVQAETVGKEVRFYALDAGLAVFPGDLLTDKKATVVTGPPGRYRLICWSAKDDVPTDAAETVVVIGDVPPGPPPPGPTPPPIPTPEPADDLYAAMKAAWLRESAADRAKRNDWAALCREVARIAKEDATVTNAGELFNVAVVARMNLLGNALPNLRDAVGTWLGRNVPHGANVKLTPANRALFSAAWLKIASYTERLP